VSSRRPFPINYEPCRVCGYDHEHDYPRLSPQDRSAADAAHHAGDWDALEEAMATFDTDPS
jgi:hypothetical protein